MMVAKKRGQLLICTSSTKRIPCIGELTSVDAVDIDEFAKYGAVLGIGPTHPPCAVGTAVVDDSHEWFDGGAVEWWDPKERFVVIVPNDALE